MTLRLDWPNNLKETISALFLKGIYNPPGRTVSMTIIALLNSIFSLCDTKINERDNRGGRN